jgi:hypothetical protein
MPTQNKELKKLKAAEHSPEFGNQELDKLYNSGKHKIPQHLAQS